MSSGKSPEYTLLTPVPLTPDVLPQKYEQFVSLGVNLPCDMVFQYSMSNTLLPMASTSLAEDTNSSDYLSPKRTGNVIHEDDEDGDDPRECRKDTLKDDEEVRDPFSPHCKIPLPSPFSPCAYWLEPSFIRRRNERERQRVRNVNDGFERLKNHLPITHRDKDKRLSKVEILRMAIRYIRSLQDLLKNDVMEDSKENMASGVQRCIE